MKRPRFLLGGVMSGSGKTTVACGLLQAFQNRGLRPSSFKCGPDYIDPMFHASVMGVKSGNLDGFFTDGQTMQFLLDRGAAGTDLSVLEGAMGYYDGIASTDQGSSYAVAAATQTPVILVVPARGMGLSVAAVIEGYCRFRRDSRIRGVILNRISPGLYQELKREIEARCGVRVFGYLPELPELTLESRHLGLHMPGEVGSLRDKLNRLAAQMERTLDFDGILALAQEAGPLMRRGPELNPGSPVRLAVARDEAFCFSYRENLELLQDLGAELVPFSPLRDEQLPEGAAGLLLNGGYPELHGPALAENRAMRRAVRDRIHQGLPTVAECGGYLYLQQTLETEEGRFPMAGVLPGTGWNTGKLCRFGYLTLRSRRDSLYGPAGTELRAHEFHYFDTNDPGEAFDGVKPVRGTHWRCIHSRGNLLCGFPHAYLYANPSCAVHFLEACRRWEKEGRQ